MILLFLRQVFSGKAGFQPAGTGRDAGAAVRGSTVAGFSFVRV